MSLAAGVAAASALAATGVRLLVGSCTTGAE